MIFKAIRYFGHPCAVGCDAKCHKAWGINGRPRYYFDVADEDDYAFFADDELGLAPIDPGTAEGRDRKPVRPSERLNKWCVRECERSELADLGEMVELHDWSTRLYNEPDKHT